MRTLVLGGIRSGKSAWAEGDLAEAVGTDAPVRYMATGVPTGSDPAWAQRVAAHRARRPAHWSTVETISVAAELCRDTAKPTLVDDVGGWLTATLDDPNIDELLSAIAGFGSPLVLVSPEVGLSVVPATEVGLRFADLLGTVNQRLAGLCDRVVLVVAGQPLVIKDSDDGR